MNLYFSNDYYKNKALEASKCSYEKINHTVQDAFFILIKKLDKEDLTNLCLMIKDYFKSLKNPIKLSNNDCYKLTQGNNLDSIVVDEQLKEIILELAYKCIENGTRLGTRIIPNNKINTSAWLSHSLMESKVAGQLAEKLGLDSDISRILGMLHDYGRKKMHSFEHVIKGYELLVDEGWEVEAIASLTHSFFNGGRCACNEPALKGFYLDDER